MKYDILIFDADETLFDFKRAEREALRLTIEELNIDYREEYHLEIYKKVNDAIWKELEEGKISQEKLKIERFRRFRDELQIEFDEYKFAKRYMYNLSLGSFLYEDSMKLIEELYNSHRLLIITNGLTDVQDNRIRKSAIAKYFEDIIVSEEVGVSKPSPKIFEYSLDRVGCEDQSKVLMIGDSLSSDIKGGINYNIDTCWYNKSKVENTTDIVPLYEVNNLLDILKIV